MSVVRAILGRFARFLVRLARRLDPALAASTDWVAPARMAALRSRYPGAPDHWLRIAARYPITDRIPDDLPPRPEGEEHLFPTQPEGRSDHTLAAETAKPDHPRATRETAGPFVAVVSRRAAKQTPSPSGTRLRPRLNFAPARKREPIARPQTPERPNVPRPILRFLSDERLQRAAPDWRADQRDATQRAYRIDFPPVDEHAAERPEWPSTPEIDRERAAVDQGDYWPLAGRGAPVAASWLDWGCSARRRETRFSLSENRWPELPSPPDEASPPLLSASDEAALIAEQIGGTWSA